MAGRGDAFRLTPQGRRELPSAPSGEGARARNQLKMLKPEQLEALVDQLDEVTLEVDHPEAQVRIFRE
jgi:hypothetical protein